MAAKAEGGVSAGGRGQSDESWRDWPGDSGTPQEGALQPTGRPKRAPRPLCRLDDARTPKTEHPGGSEVLDEAQNPDEDEAMVGGPVAREAMPLAGRHEAQVPRLRIRILLAVLILTWAVSWPAVKVGVATVPPIWYAWFRYLIASCCLFALLAVWRGIAIPPRPDWPLVAVSGVLQMAAYSALSGLALTVLPPGRASVLAFSRPPRSTPSSTSASSGPGTRRPLPTCPTGRSAACRSCSGNCGRPRPGTRSTWGSRPSRRWATSTPPTPT